MLARGGFPIFSARLLFQLSQANFPVIHIKRAVGRYDWSTNAR